MLRFTAAIHPVAVLATFYRNRHNPRSRTVSFVTTCENVEREKGIRPMPQMDGDVNAGPSSGANELMMALEREKQKGDTRYVALYHIVQETTSLTIKAADKKKEKEQRKKALTVIINAHTVDAVGMEFRDSSPCYHPLRKHESAAARTVCVLRLPQSH
jgi:hypothetical protein